MYRAAHASKRCLEGYFSSHLDVAWVAAVSLVELTEDRVARGQIVGYAGTAQEGDVVDPPWRVLRVVEAVKEIGPQLEFRALVNRKRLDDVEVEVIHGLRA